MILVSSENGYIYFWKIKQEKHKRFIGHFYASCFRDQSILGLDANRDNSILITGDTKGFLYLWDISDLIGTNPNTLFDFEFEAPRSIKWWRAHDSVITCVKYVDTFVGSADSTGFILTSSNDWCCRLWAMNGSYVGSFGQEKAWNLEQPSTYHYSVPDDPNALDALNLTMTMTIKRKAKKPVIKKVFKGFFWKFLRY